MRFGVGCSWSAVRSSALVALGACLLVALPLAAQKEKREPLTEAQAEKIRDAGIDPNERVKLYTQFLEEHAATIKSLTARVHSAGAQPQARRRVAGLYRADG